MSDRPSPLLRKIAFWLIVGSVATYVVGIATIFLDAPCSDRGAYISLAGIILAGVASCVLFVRAILVRSGDSWAQFAIAVAATAFSWVPFYIVSLLGCRGV